MKSWSFFLEVIYWTFFGAGLILAIFAVLNKTVQEVFHYFVGYALGCFCTALLMCLFHEYVLLPVLEAQKKLGKSKKCGTVNA